MTQPAPMPQPVVCDVSCAQFPAADDWERAHRESNVVGVIVRVEAFSKVAANLFRHCERVLKAGLPLGAYGYQNTDDDPRDEVAATLKALRAVGLENFRLGVWNDVETRNNHSPTQTLVWDDGYAQGVADGTGQPTGLYTGLNFWRMLGDDAKADRYASRRLWIAQYGSSRPDQLAPWPAWPEQYGPRLHQRWGNTIWRDGRTGEQRWGREAPGAGWTKIASANPVAGCAGEIDCSQIAGNDLSRVLLF